MTALTMTLLPEPVGPAISRCGILARSTALATPATSRPRANVSLDSDAVNSTSSRTRRSGTALKSLFGISMPTALLPGIGASIRSELAASAIARSSARPSMRLTLTSGAGWTSYWVTTGPALRATIRAGMPKPASFLTMISSLRAWDASSPPAWRGMATSSRTVIGGRMYSMWSLVSGESPASVTSSGSRTGRSGTSVAEAAPRAGANVLDVWALLGMAVGMAFSSSPQAPVWPGDGAAGTAFPFVRPFLPFVASVAAVAASAAAAASSSSAGVRRMDAAAVVPIQRAVPATGLVSCRNGIPNATITPKTASATRRTNAPGAETRSVKRPERARPIRPPETPRTWAAPAMPVYVIARPRRVIPHPEFGRVPGPHSSHQPASSSRNGATQRIAPNHGEKVSVHQLVKVPCPGSVSAMSVIEPRTSSVRPMIERTTSGVSRLLRALFGRARDGREAGVFRAVVRRRVAMSDLDDDREDHRSALRLLVQEARDAVLDLRLEQSDLADVVARRVDRLDHALERLLHDRVLLVEVDEPSGDDLRAAHDRTGLLVDRHDDHEHPVVGEGAAITQDDVTDIADRQPIDVDVTGGDWGGAPCGAVGVELDRRPVLDDEHVLRGHPRLRRQAAVLDLHPELTVHRDEVLRLGQAEHELELFLAGMARHVCTLDRVVVDVGAGLEQVVDRARDRLLVAG